MPSSSELQGFLALRCLLVPMHLLGNKQRSLRERGCGGARDFRWRPEPGNSSSGIVTVVAVFMHP